MNDDGNDKRPWFGPKRFGMGIRPQTWQGYLIVLVIVIFFFFLVSRSRSG